MTRALLRRRLPMLGTVVLALSGCAAVVKPVSPATYRWLCGDGPSGCSLGTLNEWTDALGTVTESTATTTPAPTRYEIRSQWLYPPSDMAPPGSFMNPYIATPINE